MRTLACCVCKNENADQLHSNCAADKHLRYIILLIYSRLHCSYQAWFVSCRMGSKTLFILSFYVAVQTGSCLAWQRLVFFLDWTYILPSCSLQLV